MDEIKTLTRDDVIERLKSMKVGENDIQPVHTFSFLVLNPDYDPESFSQEIEDSEREVTLTELAEFYIFFQENPEIFSFGDEMA